MLQLATDDEWRAEALLNLGMIAIKSLTQGQDADEQHKLLSDAGSFIFQSLEIFEDREIPDGLSRAATSLGDCYVALESRPDARRVYNFALQVCRELEGAEEHQADILARLALIADQAGEGRLRLTESRDLYVRIGMPHQAKRMQEWLDRLPE